MIEYLFSPPLKYKENTLRNSESGHRHAELGAMPFTYNEKGVLAATDGNSQLYFTSRPTGGRTFIFIYEEEQFRVEFEVLVMSKPLLYRWRGQQRDGKRDSCAYIIEPTLRGAFYSA